MDRRPSLQDIADAAGVSVATTSLALRDKGRISAEMRRKIKKLAGELGYVPNAVARSLVGGATRLIAIAMPGLGAEPEVIGSVDYYFRLLGAATAKAFDVGYGLVLLPPGGRHDSVAVDGAVIVDPVAGDSATAVFDLRGRPVVTIGRRVESPESEEARILSVDIDIPSATIEMLDHLASRGARRVDLLATKPIDSFEQDSVDAYRDWCARHSVEPRIVMSEGIGDRHVDEATARILEQDQVPDAVYVTIAKLAFRLLDRCGERGIDVPQDLLVATSGDNARTRGATPGLTVLDDRPAELGAAAVGLLIDAINNPDGGSAEVLIDTGLVVRDSTG